jgi:hypothetical protein
MATEIIIPPKPFTYADGTPAVAGQVNANFDKLFDENFTVAGYNYFGWWRFDNGLAFNASNAFESVSDVDLRPILREGDKIRWFHETTGTQRYGWVSHVDYNDTVANRTYIQVIGDTVLNEAVVLNSIGVSRVANPDGWPQDPDFGSISTTDTTERNEASVSSSTIRNSWGGTSFNITVPRGKWVISGSWHFRSTNIAANNAYRTRTGLATSTNSNNSQFELIYTSRTPNDGVGTHAGGVSFDAQREVYLTNTTTYHVYTQQQGTGSTHQLINNVQTLVVRAKPNYN